MYKSREYIHGKDFDLTFSPQQNLVPDGLFYKKVELETLKRHSWYWFGIKPLVDSTLRLEIEGPLKIYITTEEIFDRASPHIFCDLLHVEGLEGTNLFNQEDEFSVVKMKFRFDHYYDRRSNEEEITESIALTQYQFSEQEPGSEDPPRKNKIFCNDFCRNRSSEDDSPGMIVIGMKKDTKILIRD